jgi:uncharacterized protein YjbI with pentapeptide repeats
MCRGHDGSVCDLRVAFLAGADLTAAKIKDEGLEGLEQQGALLKRATMPDGRKYEDWLKDRERSKEDGENE